MFVQIRKTILIAALIFSGCSTAAYYRKHEVKNLNIVFTDPETINKLYRQYSLVDDASINYYVVGFFNPNTNTIYVEENDFETLGHEITHAVQFPYNFHGN